MAGTIRLGTAGWVFEPWRKSFYPEGLKQKEELAYASRRLGNIEINATFYSHQKPASFQNWASQTPDGFVFTVKGHQLVTHIKRLKDVELPLANFFASGVMALGDKLGPFCWQLPGNTSYDEARMEAFLELLPQSARGAGDARRKVRLRQEPALSSMQPASPASATPSKCGTRVSQTSASSPSCAGTTSRWSSPTRRTGPISTRPRTSPMRGCRAPRARRAIPRPSAISGPAGSGTGPKASPSEGPHVAAAEAGPPRDVFAFFVSTDKEHAPQNARAVMATLGLKGPGGD